jgi:diguanylate cyclase (GGDEF)-like protein
MLWAIPSLVAHAWLVASGHSIVTRVLLMNLTVPVLLALAVPGLWQSLRHAIDKVMLGLVVMMITTYPLRLAVFFAQGQARELVGPWVWSQYIIFFYLVIAIIGILTALAIMLATGMDIVAKHKATSEQDPLTGIANRRALDLWIANEPAGQQHYGAVLMIDLDRFKRINDNHGHAAGDLVLMAVAAELSAKLGSAAKIARIGGEEFAVLIFREQSAAASMLANMMREAIAAIRLDAPLDQLRLTASIGVAERDGDTDLRRVLQRADMAVYQAKSNGRNATVVSGQQRGLHVMRQVA